MVYETCSIARFYLVCCNDQSLYTIPRDSNTFTLQTYSKGANVQIQKPQDTKCVLQVFWCMDNGQLFTLSPVVPLRTYI